MVNGQIDAPAFLIQQHRLKSAVALPFTSSATLAVMHIAPAVAAVSNSFF